jgi:sigma-E factor negative regulatory protein RseA
MNSDELDSQLSAMFDDELPAPQCELLARRLARDDTLKARWGRYAAIGAVVRTERGLRLDGHLAGRVSTAIASEPALLAASAARTTGQFTSPLRRWSQPVAGAAVAAAVAVVAIFILRAASPDTPLVAEAGPPPAPLAAPAASADTQPDSYVTPPQAEASSFAPPVELADFVVAHSEFSMPLLRSSALSALVAAESSSDSADAPGDADTNGDTNAGTSHAARSR